jgi:glutathione S-transferase
MCQVDIAYVPFIERLEIAFSGLKNYDVTAGRPNLAKWLKVISFVSSLCAK